MHGQAGPEAERDQSERHDAQGNDDERSDDKRTDDKRTGAHSIDTPRPHGGMRGWLRRLTGSPDTDLDKENESQSRRLGGTPCCDVRPRQRAVLVGPLRSVTLRPHSGVPALEAELNDGSGTVSLIWLGRRHIAGVHPGRWVRVEGMVTQHHGRTVIFNPRYELAPGSLWSAEQA